MDLDVARLPLEAAPELVHEDLHVGGFWPREVWAAAD
jgi:hypothetical protein